MDFIVLLLKFAIFDFNIKIINYTNCLKLAVQTKLKITVRSIK